MQEKLPAMMRLREVREHFGHSFSLELPEWEKRGLIHPLQMEKKNKRLYRTHELVKIVREFLP